MGKKFSYVALIGILTTAAAAPPPPYCGTRGSADIGDGFALDEYLMGGDAKFTLRFNIPAGAVRARGIQVRPQPMQLLIANIDSPRGPYIGYLKFDLRRRDGRAYLPMNITLVCAPDSVLSYQTGGYGLLSTSAGPTSFDSVFSAPGYATSSCVEAMAKSGTLRMTFGPTRAARPDVVIETPLQLAAKLQYARTFARQELERAARGDCRIMPEPPPPF
jgi:hypothetical protein